MYVHEFYMHKQNETSIISQTHPSVSYRHPNNPRMLTNKQQKTKSLANYFIYLTMQYMYAATAEIYYLA